MQEASISDQMQKVFCDWSGWDIENPKVASSLPGDNGSAGSPDFVGIAATNYKSISPFSSFLIISELFHDFTLHSANCAFFLSGNSFIYTISQGRCP